MHQSRYFTQDIVPSTLYLWTRAEKERWQQQQETGCISKSLSWRLGESGGDLCQGLYGLEYR